MTDCNAQYKNMQKNASSPTWLHNVNNWNRNQWLIPPAYFKDQRPYFNMTNPDPYTYLQYWRRRMCFNNYRGYMGMHFGPNMGYDGNIRSCPTWNYNNVPGRCRYPLPKNEVPIGY